MARTRHPSPPSPRERGMNGLRKRWGPQRHLDMRDLTPDQVTVLVNLAAQFRAVNAAISAQGVAS